MGLINQAPSKNYTTKWEDRSSLCIKILYPSVEKRAGLKESNIYKYLYTRKRWV
jgi:hypothetical protein